MYYIFYSSGVMDFYSKKLKHSIWIAIIFILIVLSFFSPEIKLQGEHLIVWNVGQGQMVTYSTPQECIHFDMGGERFPKNKIFKICHKKQNIVYYTHWDLDHINFSLLAQKIFPSLCRALTSLDTPQKKYKKRWFQKIPPCHQDLPPYIKELKNIYHHSQTSNEKSRIFIIKDKILIPGDSNKKMEKYWSPLIPSSIQILIAGHHGSKTSSSHLLLSKLPQLQIGISSSRKKRYGHPHSKTVRRFHQRGILFISTEDFHHIRIPLNRKRLKIYSL